MNQNYVLKVFQWTELSSQRANPAEGGMRELGAPSYATQGREFETAPNFSRRIRRNSLKSPDSKK
jgi:hypothetical protein